MERIQGYRRKGIEYLECVSCGGVIKCTKDARKAHERTPKHKAALEATDTHTPSPVFPALSSFWVPWQLAPDSDPAERYILATADGKHEHPAGFKFSSAVEACEFLKNNPQVDAVRESDSTPSAEVAASIVLPLSQAGYAVILWTPDELRGANPSKVEDMSIELGWEIINDLATIPAPRCPDPECDSTDTEQTDEHTRTCNECGKEFDQPPQHTGELINGLVATVERAEKGGKQ